MNNNVVNPIGWDNFVDTLTSEEVDVMITEMAPDTQYSRHEMLIPEDLDADTLRRMRDVVYESQFNYNN